MVGDRNRSQQSEKIKGVGAAKPERSVHSHSNRDKIISPVEIADYGGV